MNQFKRTAFITLCILTMSFAFGGNDGVFAGIPDKGEFIHSPQAGDYVKITNLSNVYFDPRFYGAIRMDTEETK